MNSTDSPPPQSNPVALTGPPQTPSLTIECAQLTADKNTSARAFTHLFLSALLQFLASPNLAKSFRRDITKALPVLQLVLQQIEAEVAPDGTVTRLTFSVHNVDQLWRSGLGRVNSAVAPDETTLLSTVSTAVSGLLHTNGVLAVLRTILLTSQGDLPVAPNESSNTPRLFSNSKDLMPTEWAMPKELADNINRIIKNLSLGRALDQYEAVTNRTRNHRPSFRVTNQHSYTEFVYNPETVAVNTAEEFANQLLKLKDAKVLQVFFSLWKWASQHDASTFTDVSISELMGLCLKTNGENKFNTQDRREFSAILNYLASITITETIVGERVNKRTGTSKLEIREEKNVRLFRMEATYSIKKEFRGLPKSELDPEVHVDKTVITRFSGTLLPNQPRLFTQRASIFFDNLLHLDANKDGKAIVVGFHLQTRFNQLMDKAKPIEESRDFLIHLCDYQQTNQTKPSQATKQLRNNFDKLINVGIISSYSGLTNTNTDRIKLMPPQTRLLR